MSSLSFVSSSIVYYLVFKVQSGALLRLSHFFEMGQSVGLESLGAVCPLSHLSVPSSFFQLLLFLKSLVGSSGLEPPTSRLSGVRSNHLSHEPLKVVEISGIEPLTSCVQGRRSPS